MLINWVFLSFHISKVWSTWLTVVWVSEVGLPELGGLREKFFSTLLSPSPFLFHQITRHSCCFSLSLSGTKSPTPVLLESEKIRDIEFASAHLHSSPFATLISLSLQIKAGDSIPALPTKPARFRLKPKPLVSGPRIYTSSLSLSLRLSSTILLLSI
ncbi:hypothetical protein RHMOL_Rhmol02G0185600 [Rhododendron molle]|uniref:Uncharacterized protein n=1 Tax=Rhododendron molle TaxID=49168 RepID=A0ACC0PTE1_RHOML|nr:hypothetical protein RHMOL_Rhmol02G0185600 [Rhododendron molle]